ncbi:LANO_0D08724g1_1 [Lachancea nothofagi CBS 11611]|uniref:LANO_0D08724g1_1 n=1 Tax=Lachancea nothofagi CBS 11611 TaxID=1266666 RepID=A0A1G4JJR5_9SACH|nr:LANO_0D08724g1_1 [Lachancea nothofagi CBS 11611]
MGKYQAIEFGVKEIPNIIPLDKDSARQLCEQILSSHENEPEKVAERFLEILGSEDISLSFVLQFNEKLSYKEPSKVVKEPPVAQPVSKASYEKVKEQDLEPLKLTNTAPKAAPKSSGPKYQSPATKAVATQEKPKKNARLKKLQNLQEIDDVLKVLELESSESDPTKYSCQCQGNRHPLFEVAPNCLSCGKIICAREGLNLNNCTFCGAELLSLEERSKIIEVLNQEKLDMATSKASVTAEKPKKSKGYKIMSGTGTNLFSEQDKLFERIEKEKERERKRKEVLDGLEKAQEGQDKANADGGDEDSELKVAQDRLETLMHFQSTSAQRTKIIDNASDFSMSNESNVWGNAQDRALMLKKQQRNIRRSEKLEQERRGKRDKVVMDLTIGKDGKVIMTEATRAPKTAHAGDDEDVDDISDEEDARDLKDIAGLKNSLSQTKKDKDEELEANIWDPEKDRRQFKKPVYVDLKNPPKESEKEVSVTGAHGWKKRVQISQDSESSLEQNILAVL